MAAVFTWEAFYSENKPEEFKVPPGTKSSGRGLPDMVGKINGI